MTVHHLDDNIRKWFRGIFVEFINARGDLKSRRIYKEQIMMACNMARVAWEQVRVWFREVVSEFEEIAKRKLLQKYGSFS